MLEKARELGPQPMIARAFQRQPRRSRICGQTCVAMLAGVGIVRALYACTGGQPRASSEHDLRRGLAQFGLELGPFFRQVSARSTTFAALRTAVYLLRVRYTWRRHGYHWIVLSAGVVWDPSLPETMPLPTYLSHLARVRGYVTSAAAVTSSR